MSQVISDHKGEKEDYDQQTLRQSNFRSAYNETSHEAIINQIKNYQMKSTFVDIDALNKSRYTKLKKYKEALYYGEIVNGKRHGIGIILYNNSRVYEGQWEGDLKHGQGYEIFTSQCVYQGYYVNGKPQGAGKYQWPNGQFYQGQWLNGLKHGTGMWKGAKGDSYVGQWKFGKADGVGVHVWINGDRYEGQFKNSLKHGEGTEKFSSKDIYKGTYFEGKPDGYGEYYWKNGSFYKGSFVRGYRQGNGIWKKYSGNSDKYQGEYLRDKKQGYGIFTWFSGNIYKGNYENDEREGYGEMYWTDGSYYKGTWLKGSQSGQGIFFTPEEGLKKCIFTNNNLIEIYQEQEPQIPEMVMQLKKRKNHRIKSISNKLNQMTPYNRGVISKLSPSPIVQNGRRYRKSMVKEKGQKTNANQHQNSYNLMGIKFKKIDNDQISKKLQTNKEHMPHSSVKIHHIDKKMHSPQSRQKDSGRVYSVLKYRPKNERKESKGGQILQNKTRKRNQSTIL